jgi:hypothetical protein
VANDDLQVIRLRLAQSSEMFEMPQSDLFSEYRNFLTGVDYCISELRSRRSRAAVRLEISLPPSEIEPDLADRMGRTLRRYCEHKMSYNDRERSAVRYDGVSSLRIGLPIAAVGLAIAVFGAKIVNPTTDSGLVLDTGGWVLAWVGLWYPLDTLFFSPLGYGRENRVLRLLHGAEVVVQPHP